MSMYDIIAVSNRALCSDFLGQLKKINSAGISVILREKDLSENEYKTLAKNVMEFCPNVILHTFINAAKELGCKKIHLPMHLLRTADLTDFDMVGASVHFEDEAVEAQRLGADYVIAGHIFATDCKRGLAPRGEEYLKGVVNTVNIPVYTIGGITPENIRRIRECGAKGACIMSGFMRCGSVEKYLEKLLKNLKD